MGKLIFIFFLLYFVAEQGQNLFGSSPGEKTSLYEGRQTEISYTFKIIPSNNSTWGYDILKGQKMFIHQTAIPGMPGNNGFKSKSDAKKVAQLVIEKLKNGEMPPSVTIDEMKNLKVLLTN